MRATRAIAPAIALMSVWLAATAVASQPAPVTAPSPSATPQVGDRPAPPGPDQTAAAADLARLRARVLERWRVVRVRDGIVLVPRRAGSDLRGVELSRDQVLIDGRPVTGAELRASFGGDAEALLSLSYLSEAQRLALFEAPSAARQREGARVGDAALPDDRRVVVRRGHGARVRIGSDLHVGEQDRVDGDAVVILGSATVDGEVAGDLVVVGGSVRLGPKSVVRGEVTTVGGRIEAQPESRVLNGTNEVAIMWPEQWIRSLPGGPSVRFRLWPDREWWAGFSFLTTSVRLGLVAILGLVVVVLGGRLYEQAGRQAAAAPWQSIIVGLGAQLVAVPALLLICGVLLVSIIGIPLLALVPVAVVVGAVLWLIGFAAVSELVGRRVLGILSLEHAPAAAAFLAGFVCLTGLAWLTRAVWFAGGIGGGTAFVLAGIAGLVEGVAWSAGLGALVLAWFRREGTVAQAAPPPLPATL